MSKDKYNKGRRGRHKSFHRRSEENHHTRHHTASTNIPSSVTTPAPVQDLTVITAIITYIQTRLGWKQWKKLSYVEQAEVILLLLVCLGITGMTISMLSGSFPNLFVETHTNTAQPSHVDLASNTSSPCTLDVIEQPPLPSVAQTHAEPIAPQPIAASVATSSTPPPAQHHYFCPTLSFFKTNKLKTQQDAYLRLQTHGCSITSVNPDEKIRQGIMSEMEDLTNQQAKAYVEEVMRMKAYNALTDIEFYLFKQALIGKMHYEAAVQLGSARCGSSSVAALFKIIQHYVQSIHHEPCPIIFMISANGRCDISLDEHPIESNIRIQEHAFLVSVDPNAIPIDVLNTMVTHDIPKETISLASLESYNPEICDAWQGKTDTYQLSKTPLKHPNGEYSFWHPRAWKSATVIGMFYLPPQSNMQILLNPLFDESSTVSKRIKRKVGSIIREVKSELPDIAHYFLSLDNIEIEQQEITRGLRP